MLRQLNIKLYKIDSMAYTPFDINFLKPEYEYLKNNGICLCDSKKNADILVASSLKKLLKGTSLASIGKPALIWTNEPRASVNEKNWKSPFNIPGPIMFMNIYSNKVFINNATYQEHRFKNADFLNYYQPKKITPNRKLVGLMSFYKGTASNDLYIRGKNLDLINIRNQIALYGYHKGLMDIYGKGWPPGISLEDSRKGNWTKRKKDILSSYHFNLAFENTVYPYYITEKIWDAIENHCLPVYYGGKGSTIYEDFPENSFLDYAKINSAEKLFDKIATMPEEEFTNRMNACVKVYNKFVEKEDQFWQETTQKRLDNIVNACRSLVKS